MRRISKLILAMAVTMVATIFVVAENTKTVSAHHPLVGAETIECVREDATSWPVYLKIESDAPNRGKEYSVFSPAGVYWPSGWISEATPFTRTELVPVDQASYSETVEVSWRPDGPTKVSGTAMVNRPPTCPPLNTVESVFVFCEEAGATNGPVPLSGTANGLPVSFAAGQTLLFPYDDAGQLHLILKDGDIVVFDKVLSAPKQVGCDFVAEFVGSSDCDGVISGTLTVNTDGIDEFASYRVNGGEWVKMTTGASQNLSGITGLDSIEVGYPESGPLVQATMSVVGPPAGSCDQPLPKPSATFTPPTCTADGSLTLSNTGTAPAEFMISYFSLPAGAASGFKVTLAPGETRVVWLDVELGRYSLVVESGGKVIVDQLLARPANCTTPQLPATGAGSWWLITIASLLLLIGGLLVSVPRKWRKSPSSLI